MIKVKFQEDTLPLLGFGAMRLPENADGSVDVAQVEAMVAYAMEHGVNYFDTAWPYHAGLSEIVMGKVLAKYPRDSYRLATKYPGHMIASSYDPAEVFEQQLKKCGVEYFDYYLLHNVNEQSIQVYMDPKWGILDYFRQQKKLGRIRHLGFSTHSRLNTLERFLDYCGEDMEFCQIQLNYLDWTLQDAKSKYELLTQRGIPVWVMEPVRGGKLVNLPAGTAESYQSYRPDESVAAWAFRFLQGLDNVQMILSGMSNMAQLRDNVQTFAERKPLNDQELALVFSVADKLKNAVPCTGCRYCVDGCPMGLNIPMFMSVCTELRFADSVNTSIIIDALPDDQKPSACIGCGQCSAICPQGIDIPGVIQELDERLSNIPKWRDICRQREEEQRKLRNQ